MRPRPEILLLTLCAALPASATATEMPWGEAGLTERQAAAHLLHRFTFGPRPGEVDRVVEEGLEAWFERQLTAQLPEPRLDARLVELEPLFLSIEEIGLRYPNFGVFLRQAREAGVLPEEFDPRSADGRMEAQTRRQLVAFAAERGYRPQRELVGALLAQKVYRAVYAENQLHEVMTDFWFNHFNVSLTDNQCRGYVLAYERDAVRPYALTSFRDMLGATARHPAMLLYLDNAQSTAGEGDPTTLDRRLEERLGSRRGRLSARRGRSLAERSGRGGDRRPDGLNENYARELLELHTLGVDGGYSQQDVVEVARAFTGWSTVRPQVMMEPDVRRRVRRALAIDAGFVVEEGFVFRADAHDAGTKVVLGRRLAAGRGLEDGEEVLDILAAHPSTARHLATKLAVRFVADTPPPALVDRLARRFLDSGGELRPVLREMVASPEFWSPEAVGEKVKSPFELAVSALRAVDAEVEDPRAVVEWVERMGQPLYAYQAPTGYPDEAEFWVSSGGLLNRMNFALALAAGRLPGVRFDLSELVAGGEPPSRREALEIYVRALLPERDSAGMVELLEPLATAPDLEERIAAAGADPEPPMSMAEPDFPGLGRRGRRPAPPARTTPPTAVEQVAGVILGSPEFQKR